MRLELPRNWKAVAGLTEATRSAWEDQQDRQRRATDKGLPGEVAVVIAEWDKIDEDVVKNLTEELKGIGITVQEIPASFGGGNDGEHWCLVFSRQTLTDQQLREIDVDHNLTPDDEG